MYTTTKFKKSIKDIDNYKHSVLKVPTTKVVTKGTTVRKGKYTGYTIKALTLTERTTCPSTCNFWNNCYGNNMPFAHRFEYKDSLVTKIKQEVTELCATKKGLIVRLHILGDFPDVAYVEQWITMLQQHKNLAVWGYTHHPQDSAVGIAIKKLNQLECAHIRWSDQPEETFSACSEKLLDSAQGSAVYCPEQLGQAKDCASCTLCWSNKSIKIIWKEH